MARAELRWPPFPYRAGFTITDDTDASELPAVRAVYDVLAAQRVRVTRTVWRAACACLPRASRIAPCAPRTRYQLALESPGPE